MKYTILLKTNFNVVIIIHGKYNVRFSVIRFVAFDINVQQISIRIIDESKIENAMM
jgi:hypothetical protein